MNELEKRSNLHKKKSKGLSYFTKLDAGDVPKGTEIFNKGMSADSSAEAAEGALGEEINKPIKGVKSMPKVINIRESLNTIDKNNFNKYDLLNLYEACNMPQEDKKVLATMLAKNESAEVIYKYLYKKSCPHVLKEARKSFRYKFYFCTGENARERRPGNDDLFTDTYKCVDDEEALECAAQDVAHMEWSEPFDDSEQSAEEYLDSIDFGSGAPFCYGIQNLDTGKWIYGADQLADKGIDEDIVDILMNENFPEELIYNKIKKFLSSNQLKNEKFETETDKSYLKSAIDEMSRYVRNWSFMPLKDRRNISPEGISKLKKDLKSAEDRLKQLSATSIKETLSDKLDIIAKEAIRVWYEDEMLDTTNISWRKLIERAGYDWDDFSYEDQQKLNKLLNKYDDEYIAANIKSAKTNDNVVLDETGHKISDVADAQRWLRNNTNEYGNTAYFPPKIRSVLDKLIGIYGNTYFWH